VETANTSRRRELKKNSILHKWFRSAAASAFEAWCYYMKRMHIAHVSVILQATLRTCLQAEAHSCTHACMCDRRPHQNQVVPRPLFMDDPGFDGVCVVCCWAL
jgi:hypothetical protein